MTAPAALIGGLAAVVAAALLALGWRWWRRRGGRIESPEQVADAAEQVIPGFSTAQAVVGADGSGALAVSRDGRVAAARLRGARLAVREVAWTAVRSTAAGIVVDTDAADLGRVTLAGVDALDIRRLAPIRAERD